MVYIDEVHKKMMNHVLNFLPSKNSKQLKKLFGVYLSAVRTYPYFL